MPFDFDQINRFREFGRKLLREYPTLHSVSIGYRNTEARNAGRQEIFLSHCPPLPGAMKDDRLPDRSVAAGLGLDVVFENRMTATLHTGVGRTEAIVPTDLQQELC